ncbi:MAG: hypothetical protein E6X17_04340 [Sporomusaceae bacterium]|nr:hypothetical protein [Sporomusaceae bacterium]
MNIRSIDLQVLIPHSAEVGKLQHSGNQQPLAQQQEFAAQWQKTAQERQQQVQLVNHSEGGRVKEKGKEEAEKRRKQKASPGKPIKESDAQTEAASPAFPASSLGHTIDIRT